MYINSAGQGVTLPFDQPLSKQEIWDFLARQDASPWWSRKEIAAGRGRSKSSKLGHLLDDMWLEGDVERLVVRAPNGQADMYLYRLNRLSASKL